MDVRFLFDSLLQKVCSCERNVPFFSDTALQFIISGRV